MNHYYWKKAGKGNEINLKFTYSLERLESFESVDTESQIEVD